MYEKDEQLWQIQAEQLPVRSGSREPGQEL